MDRIERFLKDECGLKSYEIAPITPDASSRRYWRIFVNGKSFVLMDGNPVANRYQVFFDISELFNSVGVRAPKVLNKDMENGFMLLEDFGDGTFTHLFNDGHDEELLYRYATELLINVVKIKEKPVYIPEFTPARIVEDFCLFTDWYCPCVLGHPLDEKKKEEFVAILQKLLPSALRVPTSISIWDYHVDNLMLLPDDKTCGVLDFQDAYWGPVTYDLASVLEDRREAPEAIHKAMVEKFFQSLNGVSRDDFENSFNFFSMLRHMRVLGRFTTLTICKGRTGYGKYIPHIWKMLERTLQSDKLSEMKKWVDEVLPKDKRVAPVKKPINRAIILAAGRGTRMREIGDETPKPLIKVKGKALIDYKLDMLRAANIHDVVVNVCHQREKLKSHLKEVEGFNIMISEEEEALETGGGVKYALSLLGENPFFTINSDELWKEHGAKTAMWKMIDKWDSNKHDIMLLLAPMENIKEKDVAVGNYKIVDEKMIRNANKEAGFPYFYVGTALVHPRIFKDSPDGKFSMRDLYDRAQVEGRLTYVMMNDDVYHVGTPEDLAIAEESF